MKNIVTVCFPDKIMIKKEELMYFFVHQQMSVHTKELQAALCGSGGLEVDEKEDNIE